VIYEYGDPQWNDADGVKSKNTEKTSPTTTLSTTRTDPGAKPGLQDERQATNRLNHGTAMVDINRIGTFKHNYLGHVVLVRIVKKRSTFLYSFCVSQMLWSECGLAQKTLKRTYKDL
jgi:hypothetical protein